MRTLSSFQFQGHKVAYRREGRGQPMVFLHNGGTSHRIWEPLLERYAREHDVIAMDMLGFGASDRPHLAYSLELYVAQLHALLDELGLDDVTLVGNCMGSATAIRYATEHPSRINAVIAANVLTDRTIADGDMRPLLWLARRHQRVGRLLAAFSARVPTLKPIAAAFVRTRLLSEPQRVSPELRRHLREAMRDRDEMRVLLNISENIASFTSPRHKPDAVPVCIIWGADNKELPAAAGAAFCQAFRPDRELVIRRAGHLVMLERPNEVAAAIDAFRADVKERTAAGVTGTVLASSPMLSQAAVD
jgi:pimeloyl-ACP methyl ester carboxylesterase